MFARFVALLPLATLAAVAAAAPNVLEARTEPVCNSGSVYCCNSTFDKTQYFDGVLAGLLSNTIFASFQCTSISLVEILDHACTQQTVYCENVHQNGLVNVGCSPISL